MKIKFIYLLFVSIALLFAGCEDDPVPGPPGRDGQDATVYYSEWFSPAAWSGTSGDWYFDAAAPDLTEDIVEGGVILAYAWLADDIVENAVRPLPAYVAGANWEFLVPEYETIEFICDMSSKPATSTNKFRFIAIPGTIPALKSASTVEEKKEQLKKMSYQEICKMFNIPE